MYSFLMSVSLIILIASIVLALLWKKFQENIAQVNFESLSSIMPFDKIKDDKATIVCQDGTIAQAISIKAIDYALYTKDKIADSEQHRQVWLDRMAQLNARIRIFTVRDQKPCILDGEFPNEVLEEMHKAWMNDFKNACHNKHYIMLSVSPKQSFSKFKKVSPKQAKLNKLVETTLESLSSFEPEVMKQERISPILSFLARLAVFQDVSVGSGSEINKSITPSELLFANDGVIEVDGKYVIAVSINTWGETCDRKVLDEALRMDSELTFVHNLQGHSTIKCITPSPGSLIHSAGQAKQGIGGEEIEAEYLDSIERIKRGEVTMYEYQMTIFVANKDKQKCLETVNKIKSIFTNEADGITVKQSGKTLKHLYLSMFPSNDELMYPSKLLSDVLSHWIAFSGEAKGSTKSNWGDSPLSYYKTVNEGAYSFQVHASGAVSDLLAHTLTIAPTGEGKTTIWGKIIADAIRFGVNCYAFDRLNGMNIFTNAIRGIYVALVNILNPLCCTDTPENRAHLNQLLLMMAGCSDKNDKESQDQVNKAVKNIFGLPIHARTLTNVIDACFAQGNLKRGLELWTGNNVYGHWFNGQDSDGNAFDALDISASHLVTFDMTEIQKTPLVATCVQHYIMHKIRDELRGVGKPHLIFIDEASPQLKNADFRAQVEIMLQEHRKLRGSVNLIFRNFKTHI